MREMGSSASKQGQLRLLTRGVALSIVAGLVIAACQAAPAITPAPEPQITASLFLMTDTVQGPANLPEDERAANVCVQKNRFAKNEEIVWRVRVIDPATDEPMDDEALSAIVVKLPDQELPMRWGPHPRDNPTDFFWTVAWTVPEDYPSGLLPYTVEATATDGRTGVFEQFGVAPAQLAVTEEVRPEISE
jgi:hypothetical protein